MSESQTRSFEQALEALENRVRKLEAGDMPLEEALSLFEEGIELTRECHEKLDAADQRSWNSPGVWTAKSRRESSNPLGH